MKTISTYLLKNMLATLGMALLILVFVMLSGHFFRAFDLLSRGVPLGIIGKFLLYMLPDMLKFVLPLALLISTVLVFSRFSADNEIVAMKAIGLSIWQIVSPLLLISVVFCGLCLWIALFISPLCRYKGEQLRWQALAETPITLLEPGTFSQIFPNCRIRIGARQGDEMQDIHIVLRDKEGSKFQDVVAKRGRVNVNAEEELLELSLEEAVVSTYRHDEVPGPGTVRCIRASSIKLPLNYGGVFSWRRISRKAKYLDVKMLCARIAMDENDGNDVSANLVTLHRNIALALSPFSFFLLGLPFGIRSKRSELSIGLLVCVILAVFFYAFMLLANTLKDVSFLHPQYIIWIPNILYQGIGLYMLKRLDYKG